MTPSSRQGRYLLSLLALLLLAIVTRFYHLGEWPLFGDELYTLQDSTEPFFSVTGRPLLFWLNHHLVQPVVSLDALGLRLLPAIFGVAGVAVLVEMGRRTVTLRTGLLAGLLTALHPWHLVWSQTARYYTLVFLLSALSPAALYLGVRDGSRRWTAVGVVAAALAWFAHPTAILPTAGFLVWLVGYALVRTSGRRRRLILGGVAVAVVAGAVASYVVLSQWTSLGQEWGIGGIWVAVSYGVRLTGGVALAAAAGMVLLYLDGRTELATFLAAAVAVPVMAIGVLGEFVSAHTGFLFATAPYALLAAAAFADRAIEAAAGPGRRAALGVATVGLIVVAGIPSFVSHYVDGGRGDFRGAAHHVAERAGEGDLVLATHTGPFQYYTPALVTRPLMEDTTRLDSIYRSVTRPPARGELWVVPLIRSQGGFGLQGLGEARGWVWRHCELSARLDPVRIDHQRNIVEVWRCPGPASSRAGVEQKDEPT